MKKKTLALTMAMAMVLSLVACGNSNADVAAESTAAATTEAATEATTEAATEASTDKIIEHALVVSEHAGFVEEGDTVIVSAGIATSSDPSSKRGLTNTMRVVTI